MRRALVALVKGGTVYPKGSLFMDCQAMEMNQLVALAQRRGAWIALALSLHTCSQLRADLLAMKDKQNNHTSQERGPDTDGRHRSKRDRQCQCG